MRTIQRDDAKHGPGDQLEGQRRRGGCGCGSHRPVEDKAARRRALEEHQRDLEQELADVAEQLRDLSTDGPATGE